MKGTAILNETLTAKAFSRQSLVFDELYAENTIVAYKRERVRDHLKALLKPGSHILELNCGTGQDALFLAKNGHRVHATDISSGMLDQLMRKISNTESAASISTECCSFTNLNQLKQKGQYDHVFSNFGGLNCTDELDAVLHSLGPVVKSGGTVTLVVISSFCIWETLLLARGKWKTATRRWFAKNGAKAHVEGTLFKCWYYSPSYVIKHMEPHFEPLAVEGLCIAVPPSYLEGFAEKHSRLYRFLLAVERRIKNYSPWKRWGDYYIISLKKK